MLQSAQPFAVVLMTALLSSSCASSAADDRLRHSEGSRTSPQAASIVGTWFVTDIDAPILFHMYVFNADGTMQQANPDAGNEKTSDSDGKGIWIAKGDRIKGKWVEVTADRSTHKFVGRGELSFDLKVDGDRFTGPGSFLFFDVDGKLIKGPDPTTLTGTRVTLTPPP
jgi:hypothetical protein